MLIDEGLASRRKIQNKIEEIGFRGRNEDQVRHDLKLIYRDLVMAKVRKQKTPEARFKAMRRMTKRLNSADKGNITEAWYYGEILNGKGERHVAANKERLAEEQGIELEKNRYVDIVDGNIAREIKSGEKTLSDAEMLQMLDYAKMVDGRAKLKTSTGTAEIKSARYTFTSPDGAKANVGRMREAFRNTESRRHITFEVFNERGKRIIIRDEDQLNAQRWLFE